MKVSVSKIKAFKACRRMYQLKYIEGLEPVQTAEALETGKSYHHYIDMFYKHEELPEEDFSKERAMFEAYKKYIAPKFEVVSSEEPFEIDIGEGDFLVGIIDAVASDEKNVEHKTTSIDVAEQYEYNLQWDEQVPAYMLATGRRNSWYTIIRKPTIRQKQNETEEEFFARMVEWYDTDTESKINVLTVHKTDEEIEDYKHELRDIVDEMKSTTNFYRNTCHCNAYGRRCEYASICLHYDPNENYIEFMKKEK